MNQQPPVSGQYKRRQHFIDRRLQGRLILGLMLLELLIFGIAMWLVYVDLQQHIDARLYRIHQVQTDSLPVLLAALFKVIPWMILLNVFVLIMVDRIWAGYIKNIVVGLELVIADLKNLKLRSQARIRGDHQVLQQVRNWLDYEQQRNREISQLLDALPEELPAPEAAGQQSPDELLEKILKILP